MKNNAPTYSAEVVQPFRNELTAVGFVELFTPADVDAALNKQDDKAVLVVLNSVCGCAAGKARPGVILSMLNELVPDEYVSIFAGMEKEAVEHFRQHYLQGYTPSSPNIALFRNGKLLHLLQRYQVEGKNAGEIATDLTAAYVQFCQLRNSAEKADKVRQYIESRYR